jgi:hypothetical protein
MRRMWAEHLEKAVDLIRQELIPLMGQTESQEYLLSCGRVNGIGPKVMKQAAAKLKILFERRIYPDTGCKRIYWKLPQ